MAVHQAPPSMGFSRQEYWSGVPLPSPQHMLWGHKIQCTTNCDLRQWSDSKTPLMPQLCKPWLLQGWWDGGKWEKGEQVSLSEAAPLSWSLLLVAASLASTGRPWKPSVQLAPSWGLSLGTHVCVSPSEWPRSPLVAQPFDTEDVAQIWSPPTVCPPALRPVHLHLLSLLMEKSGHLGIVAPQTQIPRQ